MPSWTWPIARRTRLRLQVGEGGNGTSKYGGHSGQSRQWRPAPTVRDQAPDTLARALHEKNTEAPVPKAWALCPRLLFEGSKGAELCRSLLEPRPTLKRPTDADRRSADQGLTAARGHLLGLPDASGSARSSGIIGTCERVGGSVCPRACPPESFSTFQIYATLRHCS